MAPPRTPEDAPDGRTVYFNRVDDEGRILTLRSRWRNGKWTSPKPVGFSDGTFRDVDPFVTSDGQRLFFTTDRTESGSEPSPDFDIWVAERDGDAWGAPERLPFPPNSSASEAFVSVTEGGTVYFSSTGTSDSGPRQRERSRGETTGRPLLRSASGQKPLRVFFADSRS